MNSPLHTLVYLSTTSANWPTSGLESLLVTARAFNSEHHVTGVLLYAGTHFMQCLEGSEASVRAAYSRIQASKRHRGLVELLDCPTDARRFSDWSMGLGQPPESELLRLYGTEWTAKQADGRMESPGLILLDAFWKRNLPKPPSPATS